MPEPEPEPVAEEEPSMSQAELDAMFADTAEPEPFQSLVQEDAEEEKPIDPEKIPDPEPIPQVLSQPDVEQGPKKKSRLVPIIAVVVAVLLIGGGGAAAFLFRDAIMKTVPFTAKIYGLVGLGGETLGAGLDIRSVKSERENQAGTDVLVVRGTIANVSEIVRTVPMIRVALFDVNGKEIQTSTTKPTKPTIEKGAELGFRAEIRDPSPLARRLEVTFVAPPAGSPPAPPPAQPKKQ